MGSTQNLSYIINHVFLPPKLPQKDDSAHEKEHALIYQCQKALILFQAHVPPNERWRWTSCSKMLSKMLEMRDASGDLMCGEIESSLRSMVHTDVLAFYIRGQNAGLIIRKLPEYYSFESFELSPTTKSVMQTKGRLQRCFPGPTVAVGQDRMADPLFRQELAQLLEQLDINTPSEAFPIVSKAKSHHIEVRDSVHPKFVTEMLTGILRGVGKPVNPARVYKRTRDDVVWKDALRPWRRSPVWLLLRVALQTSLMGDLEDLHNGYKSFMIFFMAHILQHGRKAGLASDLLFVMTSKISKRTLKLGISDDTSWTKYVGSEVEGTHQELAGRWKVLEENPDPFATQQNWRSSELSFAHDTSLSLLKLGPYLQVITARETILSDNPNFRPDCPLRIKQCNSLFPELYLLTVRTGPALRLVLADLELWVQDHLDAWLIANLAFQSTCTMIADLIQQYTMAATSTYLNSPQDVSLMILTSMDLWVALDKCAVHHYPLLEEYSPGFPMALFDPLLLPKRHQMERLVRIEQYLAKRRNEASPGFPCIFQDINTSKSFAVKYYEQSTGHQQLRLTIETAAKNKRDDKMKEFAQKKQNYQQLMQDSNAKQCEKQTRWKRGRSVSYHEPSRCQKCKLKATAEALNITVHEWPLPNGELETKSAVFELDVPVSISKWRDATYRLLVDILSPPIRPQQAGGQEKMYLMGKFPGLTQYFQSQTARVQLASTAKPFVVAHYGVKPVSQATKANICVNNGLKYSMYDSASRLWTARLLNRCDVRTICTLQLPPGPYQELQFALDGTKHTSNEALAMQSKCPKSLNLLEFHSFATLRSGDRLQWRNIARELAHKVLNYSHEETHMLVTQAAWHVGRSESWMPCRESHIDLEEQEFGMSLLSVLEEALTTVEGNWQGAIALRTFVILTNRLLSMSPHNVVQSQCILFLRRARRVALDWTRDVGQLLDETQGAEELDAMNLRVLEMALTCHGTFDADERYVSELLKSGEDIATITECSIVVHDRCPAVTDHLPPSTQSLLHQYRRLSQVLESTIRERILEDRGGIDSTVHQLWKGYQPGSCWRALKNPCQRWLTTQTSSVDGYSAMAVHYNILDGSLLINGVPLTRLPQTYELHSTYRRLFGQKVLDVIPSTMSGMVFETRNEICGQQVHFAMYGCELIIRTRRQMQICEVIPVHALEDDFPKSLVQNYAHWLDVNRKSIEWRPLKHAWISSPDNWQMQVDDRGMSVLSNGSRELIDVRSPTASTISRLLSPLEQATHIHITLNRQSRALEAHLPRLKLDFLLKDQQCWFESKQFRGMVVDEHQSFGAFTGLVNKLVLREIEGSSRTVIVPYGSVSFAPKGHHVQVMIDTAPAVLVRYHSYHIDSQLGRLVDNGNLQSRLFRLYLHATTSHCLKDQLTGRTGTEEALYGLRGAATHSFIELDPVDIELLKALAKLTPRRRFYPEHLKVMQQVDWNTLSPLSQHYAFQKEVASLLDQARTFQMFQECPLQLPALDAQGEEFLLERAALRDSCSQVHDFGAEVFTSDHDTVYASRDQVIDGARGIQACHTAKLVDNWSTNLSPCPRLLSEIESWGGVIYGPGLEDDLTIGFDLKWLDKFEKFLPEYWSTLLAFLSRSEAGRDKYKIMIFLSTLSYSLNAKQELVQTLLAFATIPELRVLRLPSYTEFHLAEGYSPVRRELVSLMRQYVRGYRECPEYDLPALPDETWEDTDERRRDQYQTAKERHIEEFVEDLVRQWPQANISPATGTTHSTYLLIAHAAEALRKRFQSWHYNAEFKRFIDQAQIILDAAPPATQNAQSYPFSLPIDKYIPGQGHLSFSDLFRSPAPHLPTAERGEFDQWTMRESRRNTAQSKLAEILEHLGSSSTNEHELHYTQDLFKSFHALHEDAHINLNLPSDFTLLLKSNLRKAQERVDLIYQMICSQLLSGVCNLSCKAQMIPRLSPTSLLSYLTIDKVSLLSYGWKEALIEYGISITALQRAERLLASAASEAELLSELANPGHQDWNPACYPEWLLLEIENNILIRQEQSQISREMISPSSGQNSVMQLNMGLGKSSVIVPTVAATLADRKQLVRVIVLKPLAMQMFHLLVKKLGGMLNRRIFYMPISRSLQLDVRQAEQIRDLYEECMQLGGILLLQPEHILSFELMGLERLFSNDAKLGNVMVWTQDWLRQNSRDILDESDEILSVRFELIYTVGAQCAIEFSPDRWAIIKHVLGLLGDAAQQFEVQYPHSLEVIPAQPGAVPRIRILQTLGGHALLDFVAGTLCETGLHGVPVCYLSTNLRKALHRFITDPESCATVRETLHEVMDSSELMKKGILLLKGLFAGGILEFALAQKRWRVNYGRDPSRTMLAVPYHAKDQPTARSEFSHPDATIVLTCLTYYYGGISDEELRVSFEALLQSDHAKEEYEKWVKDAPTLAPAFRDISGINLSNLGQCAREVFPPLRFARSVINFYLAAIVFPAEMKAFSHKLSSSGWDIAREKAHPTTGFSGTNDSRYILPLSISQCDLPPQLSTNAAVLDCLLRPENSFVDAGHLSSGFLGAEVLLKMALELKVRVILDVGAQVLELQNEEVAHSWLSRVPESEAQAAVFFDTRNEICVLSRDGTKEPLLISPFAKQMDQCLVYLDDSHTRGTDLKLPVDYRAIVTLGPRLTKDRLVQACMRMRKLGKGQSVVFCSSMEVQRKIRDVSGQSGDSIEVADVLKWCIAETNSHTRKSIPLWATQGVRHQRRQTVYAQSQEAAQGISRDLVKSLLEPEAQSLQQRYGDEPTRYEEQLLSQTNTDSLFVVRQKQLNEIRAKCREFEVTSFNTATLQEEQERELSPENEREQQVELPPSSSPLKHYVHPDVRQLITRGVLNRFSDAFLPAFETLRRTTASNYYDSAAWPDDLLVTADFANTIHASDGQFLDSFLRPVNWILSCNTGSAVECVVISPYEAQELLPAIRRSKIATLHTYSPRPSASVRTLDDLSFCAIPAIPESLPSRTIIRHLNLFAGQLYVQDFKEYTTLCEFLGLCSQPPDDSIQVACDGFISPTSRAHSEGGATRASPFTTSPVAFLRMIMTLRRKGQSIAASHFGKILNRELIREDDFMESL